MISIQPPRTSPRGVDVSVVPMINIVFLLLLYFLVAGRLVESSGPTIELPIGGGALDATTATEVLHIDRAGRILAADRFLDEATLARYLTEQGQTGGLRHVVVRADARASAAALHTVMNACRAAGIGTFELATVAVR